MILLLAGRSLLPKFPSMSGPDPRLPTHASQPRIFPRGSLDVAPLHPTDWIGPNDMSFIALTLERQRALGRHPSGVFVERPIRSQAVAIPPVCSYYELHIP